MNMKFSFLFLITTSLLMASCQSLHNISQQQQMNSLQQYGLIKPAKQTIAMQLPVGMKYWKIADQSITSKGIVIKTIPNEASSLADTNETIRTEIIPYANDPGLTARKLAEQAITGAKKYCQQIDGNIVNQNTQSVIYTLTAKKCTNGPDQIQTTKIFNGIDAIYFTRYTAKIGFVSSAKLNAMSRVIRASRLIANPEYR